MQNFVHAPKETKSHVCLLPMPIVTNAHRYICPFFYVWKSIEIDCCWCTTTNPITIKFNYYFRPVFFARFFFLLNCKHIFFAIDLLFLWLLVNFALFLFLSVLRARALFLRSCCTLPYIVKWFCFSFVCIIYTKLGWVVCWEKKKKIANEIECKLIDGI